MNVSKVFNVFIYLKVKVKVKSLALHQCYIYWSMIDLDF
jgi:hypothetical protein